MGPTTERKKCPFCGRMANRITDMGFSYWEEHGCIFMESRTPYTPLAD